MKRYREKECETPEFFVNHEDYLSDDISENSIISSQGKWWEECEFAPHDVAVCLTMKVDEKLIWRNLNSNRSILISGKAGSGKSHLLDRFISHCPPSGFTFSYVLSAPTGIAAYNVGGETIHRVLGLGLAEETPVALFQKIIKYKRRYKKTFKFLEETDLLIIDEVSMLQTELFVKLDYLFRKVRKSSDPFGGVLLLMVGDFTQLGPVCKDNQNQRHKYIFQTEPWQLLSLSRIYLNRSFRQKEGDPFLDLLNHVRIGELNDHHLKLLKSRKIRRNI
jgi:ATP-dependent DNA helicase PIF1